MSNYNDYLELHELYHHGIKGQRWGVRRFQNEDGTLTEAGKKKVYKNNDAIAKTALMTAGGAGGVIGGIFLGKKLAKSGFDAAMKKGYSKEASMRYAGKKRALAIAGMAVAGLFTGYAVNKLRERFNKYRRSNSELKKTEEVKPEELKHE